jgi:hypothetical protein
VYRQGRRIAAGMVCMPACVRGGSATCILRAVSVRGSREGDNTESRAYKRNLHVR